MACAGDAIENPMSGERISFIKSARDTNGELLRFEYLVPPHTPGPPLHIHPYQEERFVEVLSGTLAGLLDFGVKPEWRMLIFYLPNVAAGITLPKRGA